jgi:hypothetical protein
LIGPTLSQLPGKIKTAEKRGAMGALVPTRSRIAGAGKPAEKSRFPALGGPANMARLKVKLDNLR